MWWEKIFAVSKRTGNSKTKERMGLGEMTNSKMSPDPFLKQQGELKKKKLDRIFSKLSDKAFSWSQKI